MTCCRERRFYYKRNLTAVIRKCLFLTPSLAELTELFLAVHVYVEDLPRF